MRMVLDDPPSQNPGYRPVTVYTTPLGGRDTLRVLRKMLAYHIILRIRWKSSTGKAALRLGYDSLKAEQELAITSFIRGSSICWL